MNDSHHDTPPARDELESLLLRAASGDVDSFAAVYDLTSSRVYGTALRLLADVSLAEGATHEIYLEVWRTSAHFDPARGSASTWISTIAHRRVVALMRSADASRPRHTTSHTDPVPRRGTDVSSAQAEELTVHHALARLDAPQRRALELAYYFGCSHADVAAITGAPLGTATARIRTGLASLRELVGPPRTEIV